jgi:hypothetical protein
VEEGKKQALTEEQLREKKIRSRLADRALLESGAVTPEELQRSNVVFSADQIHSFTYDIPAWRKHLATINVDTPSENSSQS